MNIHSFIFLSLASIFIQAQNFSNDSLINKTDKELLILFNEVSADSIKVEKVIRFYLDRARKEKDTLKMANAYEDLIDISNIPLKKLSFADSIIYLTKKLNNKDFPAIGYIVKGDFYRKTSKLEKAIDFYLEAYKLALKHNNFVQQVFISDIIVSIKTFWGNKQEALNLQKKTNQLLTEKKYIKQLKETCKDFKSLYNRNLLSSIQNFTVCYINLKDLDSASIYIKKGLQKSFENKEEYYYHFFYNFFTTASIEIDYNSKNYIEVITKSNKLLSDINPDIRYNLELLLKLYSLKGISHFKVNEPKKGIQFLKKVEFIFEKNPNLLLLYHRDLFKELLNYYSSKNNTKMKIKYLNKLIIIDSIFKKNYQEFEPKFIKNYEVPEILKEKETQITNLKHNYSTKTWWLLGLLMASFTVLIYYFNKQLLYKKRFKNLMLQQEVSTLEDGKATSISEDVTTNLIKNGISLEITNNILNCLNRFEAKKGYLSTEISLHNMAKSFKTNQSYLSKIIKVKKGKTFITYINDLRIEYSFNELKNSSKLRKYTINAIAKECGFSNAKHFSKIFLKKNGIYPSFYIKQLEKIV